MANPQPTPFVRFSKELFEAFYMNTPENSAACALWLWVMRWTWADFGKEETPTKSLRAIAEEVGLDKSTVHRELESLVRGRRLVRGPKGGFAIQKDYDLWRKDGWRKPRGSQKGAQISLGLDLPSVPRVGTTAVPTVGTNRPQGGDNAVPTVGTSIRSKNTVENRDVKTPQPFSDKNDTARSRAAMGNADLPPEGAPDFAKLTFKMKDELNDTWKANVEKKKAATLCRKGCGRARATDSWPLCRPCTVCSECSGHADGKRTFTLKGSAVICSECAPAPVKK